MVPCPRRCEPLRNISPATLLSKWDTIETFTCEGSEISHFTLRSPSSPVDGVDLTFIFLFLSLICPSTVSEAGLKTQTSATMAVAPRQWGCTPPISMAMPAPEEIAANDSLIAELRRENNYESPEETQHR